MKARDSSEGTDTCHWSMQASLITQVQSLETRGGWKTELNLTVVDPAECVRTFSHINDLKLHCVTQWTFLKSFNGYTVGTYPEGVRCKGPDRALDLTVPAGASADLTVHLDSRGLSIFSYSRAMSVTRL